MVMIGCCSTGSASGGHRAGTSLLLEPALQQSIKTILFVSAYLSASAASLVQGRWIYHKSTGPIGEWVQPAAGAGHPRHTETPGLAARTPAPRARPAQHPGGWEWNKKRCFIDLLSLLREHLQGGVHRAEVEEVRSSNAKSTDLIITSVPLIMLSKIRQCQ